MRPTIDNPETMIETALQLLESNDGVFWMLAKGKSMLPLVSPGDKLQVQRLKGPLFRGDILVFHSTNGLVAHRLLRLVRNSQGQLACLAQGDHALSPDPPFSTELITGRVTTLQRQDRVIYLDTSGWRRVGYAISLLRSGLLGVSAKTRPGLFLHLVERTVISILLSLYPLI